MINELNMDMEGNSLDLIEVSVPSVAWRDWKKPREW
jgi:hypothetical protein